MTLLFRLPGAISASPISTCANQDTVHSIWAHIQALVNMLAADTRGHKISERSRLIILATALRGISPDSDAQFNTLTDNTPAETVLCTLNRVEASLGHSQS